GSAWAPRSFGDPATVPSRLAAASVGGPGLLGLYTGGTLAHEAALLLSPLLQRGAWRVVDLGADEFTAGRPHPMLDPEARAARVREAGDDRALGVLLVDLVLGHAAHPDPAGPLAAAIRDARVAAATAGRRLTVVGSVVGTDGDPQGLRGQVTALEAAGCIVWPSNAQAARFAALCLRPDLAPSLGVPATPSSRRGETIRSPPPPSPTASS